MSLDSTAHCAETAPSLVKFKGSEGAWWGSQAGRGKLRASRWPRVQGHGHHLADLALSLWCPGPAVWADLEACSWAVDWGQLLGVTG